MSGLTFALYVVPVAATVIVAGGALLFIKLLPRPDGAPKLRPSAEVRRQRTAMQGR